MPDGRCMVCKKEYFDTYYKANRSKIISRAKQTQLRNDYGLTIEDANEIYARGCAICGSTHLMCIDHDHGTGEVRGGLCRKHNSAIGLFGDNVAHLARAIEYIQNKGRI